MTDHAQSPSGAPTGHASGAEGSRRDFLNLTAASVTAFGVASVAWPLISSLNPSKDVLALSSTEVDISHVEVGQAITVMWRGKPVFVRHRTEAEIDQARKDDTADLKDPQTDASRVEKPEYLIMVGVCTHLGCIPLGQKDSDPKGEFGGWYCPCHGSQYDTSGRIRKGPAPSNLPVPDYQYLSDAVVRIG